MNILMLTKPWEMAEGFTTLSTFIRLFSSMNFLMCTTSWGLVKCFTTFSTFIRLLSSMSILMLTKLWEMAEGFTTLSTFIRHLRSMNFLMLSKAWGPAKGFPTFSTFIWLLSVFLILRELVSSVTSGVPVMGRVIQEDFVEHAAFTWFSSRKSFLLQIEIWSKAGVISTLTNIFPFTDFLQHMSSVKNKKHITNDFY